MLITLRQLQIFCAVAGTGTTTAAADNISLSQSAISAALTELEKNLECSLFDRVGKRLQLNDHGRALLPMAQSILQSAQTVEERFSAAAPSIVRVGASLTIGNYLLPQLLAEFWNADQENQSTTQPVIHIANTADIISQVAEFELDFGLIEGPCHHPQIHVEEWWKDELLIVAAKGYASSVAVNQELDPALLSVMRWLMREPGSGTREALEQALRGKIPHPENTLVFNDHEAIKQAAIAGLGIACLSRLMLQDAISAGRLVQMNTPINTIQRSFRIIWHRNKTMTQGMKRLMHFIGGFK